MRYKMPKISSLHHFIRLMILLATSFHITALIAAISSDPPSSYWLVQVDGEKRDRILIINERGSSKSNTEFFGTYGWIDSDKLQAVTINFDQRENRNILRFVTPANSEIELAEDSNGLSGTIKYTNGTKKGLRLTRIDEPGFQALRNEHNTKPIWGKPKISSNSTIELVVFSASNCPHCTGWKFENLSEGKRGLRDSPEWPYLKITEIRKASYGGTVSPDFFPDHLRSIGEQLNSDTKYKWVLAVTPAFVVVVDGRLATWGIGTNAWDKKVYPYLVKVVDAKRRQN